MNKQVKGIPLFCELDEAEFSSLSQHPKLFYDSIICGSRSPRGKCLAPAAKISYRRPWQMVQKLWRKVHKSIVVCIVHNV